ncbi:hypothetical protein Tco_0900361 [Tanacetum coccineum]
MLRVFSYDHYRTRSIETFDGLFAIQAQLNNLGREIKKVNKRVYAAQVGCESCNGTHYTKDYSLKEEGKTFEEAYYTQFGVPFPQGERYKALLWIYQRDNGNPLYQERRQTMEESLSNYEEKETLKRLLMEKPRIGYRIEASMNVHDSAILEDSLPPKEKDLGSFSIPCLGELAPTKLIVELVDRTIKRPKGIAENVLVEPDLQARLLGEALILNRSLDPTYGDYIKLNDLNEPLELRRNQVEDLGPTIKDGELIDKPMIEVTKTRNANEDIEGIDEYLNFCDIDRKIHIGCAYNLQFSCMIVVENMDAYRDQDMGEVIMGKPFYREICVKARRFDGMIAIYNGHDDVTYQMARSHSRFKHLTNETKANKSETITEGPEYIRDAKIEEWLTRGHVSIHEMELRS